MRLAVISEQDGTIRALAVCQAIFDEDPSTATEVQITAQPRQPGDDVAPGGAEAQGLRSHVVEAPQRLQGVRGRELGESLHNIRTSMQLVVEGDAAYLRDR